jgi:hypothetical protein
MADNKIAAHGDAHMRDARFFYALSVGKGEAS